MSNVFFRIPAKQYPTAVRGEGVSRASGMYLIALEQRALFRNNFV